MGFGFLYNELTRLYQNLAQSSTTKLNTGVALTWFLVFFMVSSDLYASLIKQGCDQ